MSIDVLITGKLFKSEQRTSAKGKYTIGKIKVSDGEEQTFCSFIAFSESAQNALLALSEGDSVSIAGSAKLKVWTDKNNVAKPQLDVTVSNVLTVYSIKKRRDKTQGNDAENEPQVHESNGKSAEYYAPKRESGSQQAKDDFDDSIPF